MPGHNYHPSLTFLKTLRSTPLIHICSQWHMQLLSIIRANCWKEIYKYDFYHWPFAVKLILDLLCQVRMTVCYQETLKKLAFSLVVRSNSCNFQPFKNEWFQDSYLMRKRDDHVNKQSRQTIPFLCHVFSNSQIVLMPRYYTGCVLRMPVGAYDLIEFKRIRGRPGCLITFRTSPKFQEVKVQLSRMYDCSPCDLLYVERD